MEPTHALIERLSRHRSELPVSARPKPLVNTPPKPCVNLVLRLHQRLRIRADVSSPGHSPPRGGQRKPCDRSPPIRNHVWVASTHNYATGRFSQVGSARASAPQRGRALLAGTSRGPPVVLWVGGARPGVNALPGGRPGLPPAERDAAVEAHGEDAEAVENDDDKQNCKSAIEKRPQFSRWVGHRGDD
jgi:hypothetical protein